MSSGFIQLAAIGQQDVYLTGTPSITYFASVYKRHTPFVLEAYEIPFKGSAIAMGQNNIVQIPVKGDLVRATTLRLNLPPLATYGADWFFRIQPDTAKHSIYINGTNYSVNWPFGLQPYSSNATSFAFWAQNLISVMKYDPNVNKFIFPTGSIIKVSQGNAQFFGFDAKNSIGIDNSGLLIFKNIPDFTLQQAGWYQSPGLYVDTLSSLFFQCTQPKNTTVPSYIDLTKWTNEDSPYAWKITPGGRFYFKSYGNFIIRANFLFSLGTNNDTLDGEPNIPLINYSPNGNDYKQPLRYLPLNIVNSDIYSYYIYSTGPVDSNSYIYIEEIDAFFRKNTGGKLYTKSEVIRLGTDFITRGFGATTTGNSGNSFVLYQQGTYILSGVVTTDVPIQSIDILNGLNGNVLYTETFPNGTYCTGEFFFSFVNSAIYQIRVNTATNYALLDYTYFTLKYQGLPNAGTNGYTNGGHIIPFNGVLETNGSINYPLDFSTFTSNGSSTFFSFPNDVIFLNVGTYMVTSYVSNATTITFSNAQYNYYITGPYNQRVPIRVDTAETNINISVTIGTTEYPGPWSNVNSILPDNNNLYELFSGTSGNLYCVANFSQIYRIDNGTTLSLIETFDTIYSTSSIDSNETIYTFEYYSFKWYKIPVGQSKQYFAGDGVMPPSPSTRLPLDGTLSEASFADPSCSACGPDGTLYIIENFRLYDQFYTLLRKIYNGYVETILSMKNLDGGFYTMCINSKGIIYMAPGNEAYPYMYTFDPTSGILTPIVDQIGSNGDYYFGGKVYNGVLFKNAQYSSIISIRFDSQDNLYIMDNQTSAVYKVTNQGNLVFTIAGGHQDYTIKNGIGEGAAIGIPSSMAVTGVDRLYVLNYRFLHGVQFLKPAFNRTFNNSEFVLFAPLTSSSLPISYEGYHYYDSVGTWAIETADLKIGGQTIQSLTGEAIEIWNDINVPYENQPALALLTGKYDTTISAGRDYYVNLPFYFYGKSGSYLPISTINRQDVEIWITFRTLQALTAVPIVETNPVQATLIVEYVYLDQPEISWIGRSTLEYVIDQYQYQSFKLSNGNFEIILENPISCLFFVIQKDGTVPYNWINDGLQRLGLSFNGEEILTNRITDTTQLGIIEPFENFINFPTRNFYSKTFKSPINFSRIRQVLVELNITGDQPRQFRLTAVSKNVLRVADGLAGLMFISP